jgi:hypothetical protein
MPDKPRDRPAGGVGGLWFDLRENTTTSPTGRHLKVARATHFGASLLPGKHAPHAASSITIIGWCIL